MVKNLWSQINFYCKSPAHRKPVLMVAGKEGTTRQSYVCPYCNPSLYEVKSEDGREVEECSTVISFDTATALVGKIEDIICEDSLNFVETDYTGLRIKAKKAEAVVIKSTPKHIDIGITSC